MESHQTSIISLVTQEERTKSVHLLNNQKQPRNIKMGKSKNMISVSRDKEKHAKGFMFVVQ
jgi:hypothetical protein